MQKPNSYRLITKTFIVSAFAAAISTSALAQKVTTVGSTYTPSGADYSITALQGIDASNPLGIANSNAQVNLNFEMKPSIGVSYDQGNGKLKDFGIGLYTTGGGKNASPLSTGLEINYDSLVAPTSANLTLEDFDIKDANKGFKTGKVEPLISIYGAGNSLVGTATPSEVLASMVQTSKNSDIWDLNLGTLLSNMNASSSGVSRVVLAADSNNGEKTKSDPYLLRAAGKAQPVPEPASLCMLGLGVVLLGRRLKVRS